MIKPKVLFLCTENSCRTQMVKAFLRAMGGGRLEPVNVGAEAFQSDPDAMEAMCEVGIGMSGHFAKKVDPLLSERVAYLVTLCERSIERTYPIFPARPGG